MIDSKDKKIKLCFKSPVQKSQKKGELYIEVYQSSNGADCEQKPIKTIRNFDDLIDFFENEDLEEIDEL